LIRRGVLLAALVMLAGAVQADPGVSRQDHSEIRAVIHRQIEAFRRDDARGAFELVSPDVQHAFGTPERFLDVVRVSYRAVYRPSAVVFLELVTMGPDAVQQVRLTDRRGHAWLAYYAMQRQRDGTWRTNGCRLVPPVRTIPT
jgi:hypothetical protein